MSSKKSNEREKHLKEQEQREKCNTLANEKFGVEEFNKLKQANKGLYFLPVMNNEGEIIKMALMKPADGSIFNKCQQAFIKEAMRLCFIEGDKEILDNDEASNTFNQILKGKKPIC